MMRAPSSRITWSLLGIIVCLFQAGNVYAEEDTVNVTVAPESDTAIGYGEGLEEAKTLVLRLTPASGYYIDYSECQDNAGENLWYCTKANSMLHVWQTFGVLPNFKAFDRGGAGMEYESHAAVFHGLLGIIDPTGGGPVDLEFDVKVNEIDIDVDALGRHVDSVWTPTDPETEPELSEVEDKCEAGTNGGLGMPQTETTSTLDTNYSENTGKAMRVCINAKKAGTLVFSGMGNDVGIYSQDGGQQTKVTSGISISEGPYEGVFYLHTTTNFSGAVNIVAELQCAGDTEGSAEDTVRVFYSDTGAGSNVYAVYVNRPTTDDDYVPVESCGRVPVTVELISGDPTVALQLSDDYGGTYPIQFYDTKIGGSAVAVKPITLSASQKSQTVWISGQDDGTGVRSIKLEEDDGGGWEEVGGVDNIIVVNVTSLTATAAVEIDPADVTGSDGKITHFVTPKGAMPNTMTLTAAIDSNSVSIPTLKWVTATQDISDPNKATVPRNAPRRYPVMLTLGGSEIKEARVWVLWSKSTVEEIHNITAGPNATANGLKISGGYKIRHEILPATVITDVNRPDLAGVKAVSGPPDVPSSNTDVYNLGVTLSGGADKKWDASQQVRQKCLTTGEVSDVAELQTIPFTSYLNYPSLGVCGNDDTTVEDENNDPYTTEGYITLDDTVSRELLHANGANDATVEMRIHLKSFPRVQLGNNWYRIGDDFLWRAHLKFIKVNGEWQNNTSDPSGSSVIALDHNEFN